jgi:hypothetical protein
MNRTILIGKEALVSHHIDDKTQKTSHIGTTTG